jgi:short-subunit dehydrogenase
MSVLIVGGTSGLGLELAKKFQRGRRTVIVTGRRKPPAGMAEFRQFDLSAGDLPARIDEFVSGLPKISCFVYAAGYYQEGRVTDLEENEIEEMLNVGGRGLIYLVRSILKKQNHLDELITITSTSQWTPRKLEPIYNFVKAAAGHFSNAMAEDGRIGKVLVAGPSGMQTRFWEGVSRDDLDKMMKPEWVAEQIRKASSGKFSYKYIQILREPPRVEEVERR